MSRTPSTNLGPGDNGVLRGVKVVEISSSVAVAHCGRLLADQGADVILVESLYPSLLRSRGPHLRRGSDLGGSVLFSRLASSKRAVALDFDSPEGLEILWQLLGSADIVLHGFRPTEAARLGVDSQSSQKFDSSAVVAITPFGQSGPYSEYVADDLVCCAAGNISFGIGHKNGRPLKLPLSLASYQAGSMGFLAAMSYLVGRARGVTSSMTFVDVAEVDVLSSLFSTGITAYPYRGLSGRRNSNHGIALYPDVFLPCADGFVGIVCNQLQQWIRFLELLGNPDWTENPRYRNRRQMTEEYPEEVDALLVPWLADRTRQEIFDLCRERDIPVAPAYTIQELLSVPHLIDRAAFQELEVGLGVRVLAPGSPAIFSSVETLPWRREPMYGEHTVEILSEVMELSPTDVESLFAAQIIS